MITFEKRVTLVLILAFIFSVSFGMATMDMDENGNMTDCPFSDAVAICPMSFVEHITTFQSVFAAIPSKTILSIVISLASLIILYFKLDPRIYSPPVRLRSSVINSFDPPILNKLLLAISDGIVQPKLYA